MVAKLVITWCIIYVFIFIYGFIDINKGWNKRWIIAGIHLAIGLAGILCYTWLTP